MNSTVKSFTVVTLFSVVTRLLSFLFKIWMSRSLGAETVGLYQICLSVLILLFSLTAGAPTVLSRLVAKAAANGDEKRQNALTAASITIGLSVAVLLCVVFYALNSRLGVFFADPRCVPLFLIMLPTLLTSTLYSSLRSWFWGKKRFLAFSSTELLDEILKIVLSIIFAGGFVSALTGAKGVAVAFILSDIICVAVLALLFFIAGGRMAKPEGMKEIAKSTLPLSAVRIMTALSSSLTALIIPRRLVVGGMTTALATAEFGRVAGMALPLIMAPVSFVSALAIVLIPEVASLFSKGDTEAISSRFKLSLTFAAVICSLAFAMYLPLGSLLGKVFFGDATAGKFVSYCSALVFPLGLSQVTTPMLNSLGMERRTFTNYVLGAVCMLPCIFFLPTYIGIYAVAVGSGAGFLVTAVLNYISLTKKLGRPKDVKKAVFTVAFSIPLGVSATFSYRLLSAVAGEIFSAFIIAFYVLFLFIIFISAFDVVDIKALLVSVRPSKGFALSKKMPAATRKAHRRTQKQTD